MAKKLIIKAHPSKNGFTHRIEKAYKEALIKNGDKVKVIDLYDKKNKLDFLKFESRSKFPKSKIIQNFQKKILLADELIFIFPLWWVDCPSIMKNFFDRTFVSGFAFRYENEKPIGLLKGKTAKIFITCDGPGFFYRFPFITLKTTWKFARLGFCGLKLTSFNVFDKMIKRDENNRLNLLEKVKNLSEK